MYHLVFSELLNAAQHRGTVTYQELALIMGLPLQGNHMGAELGQILGEISEDEVTQHRPMLSAVAISTSGQSSSGFFGLAKDLGLLTYESHDGKRRFWEKTKEDVYRVWQKELKTR